MSASDSEHQAEVRTTVPAVQVRGECSGGGGVIEEQEKEEEEEEEGEGLFKANAVN